MKFKFISKGATVEVDNFTEVRVSCIDNNVALAIWHKPTYDACPVLFATLLGHIGWLSYDKDGMVWTDTDCYLGAESTLLRFKSPAGYIVEYGAEGWTEVH